MADRSKNLIYTLLQAAVGLAVLGGAAWLGLKLYGYAEARRDYTDMQAAYLKPAAAATAGKETTDTDTAAPEEKAAADSPVDFAALTADYPDAAAWLEIPDLELSYPVMQAQDNTYYLTHAPSGRQSAVGSIFLDCTNTLDDAHLLIYGHTMQDGSMFGSLKKYRDEAFYQSGTDLIRLYTPQGTCTYRIFAVKRVAPDADIYTLGFAHDDYFADFIRRIRDGTDYPTDVQVTSEDQVLTLSTCAAMGGADRLVVSAVLQP